MTPALSVSGLTIRRGRRVLLGPLDFSLERGEAAALIDESGSAVRALFGALDRGCRAEWTATLNGDPVADAVAMAAEARSGKIVLIARGGERTPMSPHLTVLELFEEMPWAAGAQLREVATRALDAADAVGLEWDFARLRDHARDLDLATRRRLSIALALSARPEIVVMEAPGDEVDASLRFSLLERVVGWVRANGGSLLVAAPRVHAAGALVERFIPPAEAPTPAAREDVPPDTPDRESMITVRDLRVAISMGRTMTGSPRWRAVVDGVGFELDAGGSVALLGEAGSGKSALARSLARLTRPIGGCVVWRGKNLVSADAGSIRLARRDLRIVTADPKGALDPRSRVGAAMERSLATFRPDVPSSERPGRIALCLERVGLPPGTVSRRVSALTPGEAAEAALARALVTHPKLLVCDEPTESLSAAEEERLVATLLELNREGVMLVYATQRADLALRLGRRILVLSGGRVVEDAPAVEIARDPRHPLTRAMLAPLTGRSGLVDADLSAKRDRRGCPSRPRCPRDISRCGGAPAALERVGPSHHVACHAPHPDAGGDDSSG